MLVLKKMVRDLYEYPMNGRDIPENVKIENFNKMFFDYMKRTNEYVSSVVSAYARNNGITRPVVGTDASTKLYHKKNLKLKT